MVGPNAHRGRDCPNRQCQPRGVGWPQTLLTGVLCFFAGYFFAFGLKRRERGP
jgi:hypothetical protein